MAWTYTDNYDLLPNIYVRSQFKDGVLRFYEIYPVTGYVLWIPSGDEYECDEDGNPVLDENGDLILLHPYYTYGGATAFPDYDFTTNPDRFTAILYEKGMTVFGKNPNLETE